MDNTIRFVRYFNTSEVYKCETIVKHSSLIGHSNMENSVSSRDPNGSSIVEITDSNFDMVLASSEVVFMFYTPKGYQPRDGTHPKTILFENVAKEISKAGLSPGKVVMAKLDCRKYEALWTRFVMTQDIPRFRLFRNGCPTKMDYRGMHTVEAIVEFIKEQLTDPIIPFSHLNELHNLNEDKGHIIAYLDSKDQPEYDILRKVGTSHRERCQFYVKFGDSAQEMNRPGQPTVVLLKTDEKTSPEPDETFHGSLLNFEELHTWVQEKCIPLVREVTFENAEEMVEEGLPFLVLFHKPTDTESVKKYKEIVRRELESEKQKINFLRADGISFEHPMRHLGKSVSDLPLIAIDSFQRMYLFPDYKDMKKPGKLKEFLQDFYSGKLHRYIHIDRDTLRRKSEYEAGGTPRALALAHIALARGLCGALPPRLLIQPVAYYDAFWCFLHTNVGCKLSNKVPLALFVFETQKKVHMQLRLKLQCSIFTYSYLEQNSEEFPVELISVKHSSLIGHSNMENSDSSCDPNGSSIVEITDSNVDMVLASSEVVLMFYAAKGYHPRDSTRLMPIIFEYAAEEISKAGLGPGKVVMATLDCKRYEDLSSRFDMYVFYPTFKLFRNGCPCEFHWKAKYTGENLVKFIKEQLTDPIIPFSDINELHDLSEDKGHIIAYFDSKDQPEYDVLRKVATSLKDSYRFYVKFGDSEQEMHRPGQLSVVFRSLTGTPVRLNETYQGSLLSFGDIFSWVKQKCFPLLRELKSEHEQKLRNDGPFFILLHLPSDTQSLKKYKELIRRELKSNKWQFKFLIANGTQFQQLLARFNKSTSELPLIALNCYSRVNLFDFDVFEKPGQLNEIMDKVYSEDLYLHYEGIDTCRLIDDTEEEFYIRGLFE
ncbi:uncharacterized protein LOC123879035 [Maniola jurtina]|uniref:uncharacterized protein LOC123879035 n=1 Tax=Maniola jurtina TaxID=191418 RepID=UPI001E68ADBF|nr:uncharacterized protein LOC123879035 [Maniola jurtina]